MNPPRSLRWHLAQVLLAGMLPLGAFAAVLLYLHWQAQDEQRRSVQMESTRLLAAAVDNALDSTVQRLGILARQLATHPTSEAELYEAARTAVQGSRDWSNMLAFRADGAGVFRLDRPFGASAPTMKLRAYSAAALHENRPAISPLFANAIDGAKVVGVAHPVAVNGKVTHVLIASLDLRWFDNLLASHALPEGGIAGIFDQEMKFVARSHDGAARRGSDPQGELHADMRRSAEGFGRYASLDGQQVYTSWTRTRHGWWVAVAAPAAPIDGAFWRYMVAFGGLFLLVVVSALGFAALKGRRITASLREVEERAGDLAHGRPLLSAGASPVAEIDQTLRALDRLIEAEQRGRVAAEHANRAKDEFLAMLGHELRNPIAAVSNAAAVIGSPQRSAQQLEFACGVLSRQTRHLKRLVDDLLDVGRVMTGKIALVRQPLELQAAVQSALATLRSVGTLARHRVEVHTEPVWIDGDAARFEQILTNLLVNAAAHTPAGRAIRIRLGRQDGQALLQVSDEGAGIPPEEQALIFEPFYQTAASRGRAAGGLGIGLTLVKRLVELHGGSIGVHSEGSGRGSCFTLRLPGTPPPAPSAPQEAASASGGTVLLVEDNDDARESLRMALELHGYRVLHAADAPSALEQVRRACPSVAFIDIGLPGTDGYELARAIRARCDGKVQLFALTGFGGPADIQRALDAGFRQHLTKPVEANELAAIIARAVS